MKLILVTLGIMLVVGVSAQQSDYSILSADQPPSSLNVMTKSVHTDAGFDFLKASQSKVLLKSTVNSIRSVNHLPSLFCKLEYQLESKSKLAPRFRLGSLSYTEWMEGKTDYFRLLSK